MDTHLSLIRYLCHPTLSNEEAKRRAAKEHGNSPNPERTDLPPTALPDGLQGKMIPGADTQR